MDGDGENSFSKFFMALFRKCTGCLSLEYSNTLKPSSNFDDLTK